MSEEGSEETFTFTHKELVGLLVHLRSHEADLDDLQQQLCERIAMRLYGKLSIEEMQRVDQYYAAL